MSNTRTLRLSSHESRKVALTRHGLPGAWLGCAIGPDMKSKHTFQRWPLTGQSWHTRRKPVSRGGRGLPRVQAHAGGAQGKVGLQRRRREGGRAAYRLSAWGHLFAPGERGRVASCLWIVTNALNSVAVSHAVAPRTRRRSRTDTRTGPRPRASQLRARHLVALLQPRGLEQGAGAGTRRGGARRTRTRGAAQLKIRLNTRPITYRTEPSCALLCPQAPGLPEGAPTEAGVGDTESVWRDPLTGGLHSAQTHQE